MSEHHDKTLQSSAAIATTKPAASASTSGDPTAQAVHGESPKKSNRWHRVLLWCVCGMLLAGIGVRVVAPLVLRVGLGVAVHRRLGCRATVGDVDLWLWRGAMAIEDVVVTSDPDAVAAVQPNLGVDSPRLQWDRLYAWIGWRDLFGRHLRLRELVVDGPALRILRDADGRIVFPLTESRIADDPNDDASPWPVTIDQLVVRDLRVTIVDRTEQPGADSPFDSADRPADRRGGPDGVPEPGVEVQAGPDIADQEIADNAVKQAAPAAHKDQTAATEPEPSHQPVTPLPDLVAQIEASGLSTHGDGPSTIKVGLAIGGGTVSMDGRFRLAPIVFEGQINWQEVSLPALAAVAPPLIARWVDRGRTTGELAVGASGAEDQGHGLPVGHTIHGGVTVDDLSLASPDSKDFALAWHQLEVGIRRIVVPPRESNGGAAAVQIELGAVRLAEPLFRHTRPADALQSLLATWDTGPRAADSSRPAVGLSLDQFELTGGSISYVDRTVFPHYRVKASDLAASGRAVRWPQRDAQDILLTGTMPKAAPFEITGSVQSGTGKLVLKLDHLDMKPFNPYATSLAGYRIDRGQVSLASSLLHFDPSQFQLKSDLVLHGVDVSIHGDPKAPRPLTLPNKLQLAVLRDAAGNITLPVRLSVDRHGAHTDIGRLITGAIQQAIIGAIASPLKMVGASLSPDRKDKIVVEPLHAIAGRPDMAESEEDRIENLASLLASHPQLGVVLTGCAGDVDRSELARHILLELVVNEQPLPDVPSADWFARRRIIEALAARGRGQADRLDADDQALLESYVEAVQVPMDRMHSLALSRAQAVGHSLVKDHGLSPSRVEVRQTDDLGLPGVLVEFVVAKGG